MISIRQCSVGCDNLSIYIHRYSNTVLDMNVDKINSDIARIEKLDIINKTDKKNIKTILRYLNILKKGIINDKLELEWSLGEYKVSCSPLELINCYPYGINTMNYIDIEKDNNAILKISYEDVYKIIAYEMMYRDLGESINSMEEKLSDIGIVSVVNADKLTSYIDNDILYIWRMMKISDSSYASDNGKKSYDYFGTAIKDGNEFTSGKYADCISRSFNIASMILLKHILFCCYNSRAKVQLAAIDTSGVYIVCENNYHIQSIIRKLESVVVRAFGRKFEVKPIVDITTCTKEEITDKTENTNKILEIPELSGGVL